VSSRAAELELLDRVIADCRNAHALAVTDLKDAVVEFREAYGRRAASQALLLLAHQVRYALAAVRQVEAALRRLDEERTALLRGTSAQGSA
jgi:hypothetical protein